MRRLTVVVALIFLACSETSPGGTGGTEPPPPPESVDQTCRAWCGNEWGGFSCHQGKPETVQDCYEDCLDDYQFQENNQRGGTWIAIKECEVDLECEDLFGDCDQDNPPPPAPGAGGTCPPPPGTGGTGGTSGTSGTGGTGGAGGTGGGAGVGGVGGSPFLGECTNEIDFAQLASLQPSNPRTLAASIAVTQCFNDPRKDSFIECVSAGMRTTLTNLSPTCANCYGELAWCGIAFSCNVACQSDSCLLGCLNCTNYDACLEALNFCTGRTPPECIEN